MAKDNATTTASITTATKAESNGRQLPGRVVLIGLVSFVAIFLDFESSSLTAFRSAGRTDVSDFDAKQGVIKQEVVREEELGRMQQYQLEKQWSDYTRRANVTNTSTPTSSGPEEIVVEEEPNRNRLDASLRGDAENLEIPPLRVLNVSVEEIVIAAVNETEGSMIAPMSEPTNRTSKKRKSNVTEQIVIESSDQCFPHNTKAWLKGKRLSNADFNLTDDFVYRQILIDNPLHPEFFRNVASQTICHEDSRFRNPSTLEWDINNEALIDEWEVRLMYLAIHHHHHAPAVPEARARQACPRDLTISKMDYECPSAKFLVANIAPSGLGASFRLGAVSTILMAIATDRIPIFVNNFEGGAKFLKNPSQLSSCPRGDHQCFYLPTTPCTLLAKDLRNALVLPEYDARDLRRQGILLNATYANANILVTEPRLNPPKQWSIQTTIQAKLYAIVMQLIDGIRGSAPSDQVQVLEAAAARIQLDNATIAYNVNKNASSTEYIYSNRYTKTAHATLMYLMRPNLHYQSLSDEIVASVVPEDVDPSLSIGLPIRGSDKCTAESLCYGFDTYMKLVNRMWEEQLEGGGGGKTKGDIFLTTEDKNVLEARKAYASNDSFPYRFIVNQEDVLQGSGNAKLFKDRADSIMLSSIVSMKLQLQSKFVVGNCCSNFHLMIFDLVREGCGAVRDSQTMCLQEHPDPEFHICCGWTRTEECDRVREGRAEEIRRKEAPKEKKSSKKNATSLS